MSLVAILFLLFFSVGTLLSYDLKGDQYKETIRQEYLPYKEDYEFNVGNSEAILAFQF